DRTRADVETAAPAARRAVDGPGTADGAEGLRDGARGVARRRDDSPDRAEREARARSEPSWLRDGVGRDHARRRSAIAAARSQGPPRVPGRERLDFPPAARTTGRRPMPADLPPPQSSTPRPRV